SVALTRNKQVADTGTKMIHLGKNTRSKIISKGISAGLSHNSYRGLVKIGPAAGNSRNFTQCASLLIGDLCGAHTFPYSETGKKMIHLGKNAQGKIIAEGISAGLSHTSYRGLGKIGPGADNSRNFTQCDSLLIGDRCGAHTFPYIENRNKTATLEHEATASKI